MIGSKKIVCIIPARLKSMRFPKKMLSMLLGKPLLQWVWESASSVRAFDHVAFAIDSMETGRLIDSFGGTYYMTDENCASGTDRLCEIVKRGLITADVWVNWQGDEPFISEQMIMELLQSCEDSSDIWTLKKKIERQEEIHSPHFAKVVCDHQGYALYFSRSMIPFYRDPLPEENKVFYKHVGLYAYTTEALRTLAQLKTCDIECAEQLEQLRFLYHRLRLKVHETSHEVFGIDLPEHLTRATLHLEQKLSLLS